MRRAHTPQPHRLHRPRDSQNPHYPFEVVRQHLQAHLGAHMRQGLGQEVRRAHPVLERAEHVLHRTPSHGHGVKLAIQPLLHPLQNVLMLPSANAPVAAWRALGLDQTLGQALLR